MRRPNGGASLKIQTTSILSDKTEKEAIVKLARCIKYLDGLAYLQMTAEDDYDASIALRSIKSIIETNGYE